MKSLSLLGLGLVGALSACPSHGQSFSGAYLGGIVGVKSTCLDKKAKEFFAEIAGDYIKDFKKTGLTAGLSLGYGHQFDNNLFLGVQLDLLLGAGSKKIDKNTSYRIGRAVIPGTVSLKNKDRFSLTPVLKAGYVFQKLMFGKDTLTYLEVGPNFSFSKWTVTAAPQGIRPETDRRKSSTIGLAFGGGAKVAVSEKVSVSLGYRFTQASSKERRKDHKIGHKAHNFLVGIAYKF